MPVHKVAPRRWKEGTQEAGAGMSVKRGQKSARLPRAPRSPQQRLALVTLTFSLPKRARPIVSPERSVRDCAQLPVAGNQRTATREQPFSLPR